MTSKDGEEYEITIQKKELKIRKLEPKLKNNYSITGPCQITYGINVFDKQSQPYPAQIQSPYKNPGQTDSMQTTLGLQHRADEVHYVFDFTINPNTLRADGQINAILNAKNNSNAKKFYLKETDVRKFVEAMKYGVNYVTSTTKVGAIGEFLLFVEFKRKPRKDSDPAFISVPFVPILQTKVKITKSNENSSKRIIDITDALKVLKKFEKSYDITWEIYYDSEFVDLIPKEKTTEIY
jgi:hypothetical protein